MIISLDWIEDFVDLPAVSERELADRLTVATCEVEDVIKSGELLNKVRVARIEKVEPHPDADKLKIVTFSLAKGETGRVVCGAPNVRPGMKTAFAPLGTCLPNGLELVAKKIRGVLSEGMLCSEKELGLGQDESGLMVLDDAAEAGQTLAALLDQRPQVLLDIDNKSLTHRPDLWGHYGMARELAAIFRVPLRRPYDDNWKERLKKHCSSDPSPVVPRVEGESGGIGYFGLTVENIKVMPSPSWMQKRLLDCGLRPINNIVDISNYVMLELGMPNHIFDLDKIKDHKIIIRNAGSAQKFVTLDEEERVLDPRDTVVCDAQRPLCIGGIMGGVESGVTGATAGIFIEVANWKAAQIRRSSTRLGLRTDSSQRYEKSQDTRQCEQTIYRILELVIQLCPDARVMGKVEYDGEDLSQIKPPVIEVSLEHINSVLGLELSKEDVVRALEALEFGVAESSGSFQVTVPDFRATKIECDADIIEEVGRIYGYEKIVPQAPRAVVKPVRLSSAHTMKRKIEDFMVFSGNALEIMTIPMLGKILLKKAGWSDVDEKMVLANALSKEHDRMRPSLIPNILESVALNQKSYENFRLFELGRSYFPHPEHYSLEHNQFVTAFYSKQRSPFMELVNNMEKLLASLRLPAAVTEFSHANKALIPEGWKGFHPREKLDMRVMGKTAGYIITVHPLLLRSFKIKGHLALAVLDLHDFENQKLADRTNYQPLPRFPSSSFDCTVVADRRVPVARILAAFKKLAIKELVSYKVVDLYDLNETQKTVTVRAVFFDDTKTLSGEFLNKAQGEVVKALEESGFPLKM